MTPETISYDEVLTRLREAEDVLDALLSAQADAVVTQQGVQLLRLRETDRALHAAKASLQQLLEARTRNLNLANEQLVREIENRRTAEVAFATSERKFRALLESAPEGVVAVDPSRRIVLVNTSTEDMFGYSRDELIGMPFDSLVPDTLPKIDRAAWKAQLDPAKQGTRAEALERVVHRKDGTAFPVLVGLSFTEGVGESLALTLITDITERKRMEEHLREAQKLESLGLLAGGVAHDFNNLLTAVLGNASLLADSVPKHVSHYFTALLSGAERASHVTRQLLAYAGKGQFRISDLDLSALVVETVNMIRVSIPKEIEIKLDLPANIPLIQADAGQIQQVLINLMINAAEAIGQTSNGVIGITTGEERSAERAGSSVSKQCVCMTVSDNGCGMDESTKARIFDPFYTTKVYGRGLGLSAVQGILRSCGAAVRIDTQAGKGTTFVLLFPALDKPANSEPAVPSSRKQARILIVDDEDGVRAFAAAALQRVGHSVVQARQWKEAVDLVRSSREIDLVLLDIGMPVMGGREAFEQIRRLRPRLPVVVSSGYGSLEAQRLLASADRQAGFIAKPYTAQQLVRYIDSTLGKLAL